VRSGVQRVGTKVLLLRVRQADLGRLSQKGQVVLSVLRHFFVSAGNSNDRYDLPIYAAHYRCGWDQLEITWKLLK
jgi:hypothetical protein